MIIDMTFAGRKASEFGIVVKSHRPLRAAVEETLLRIPGRDGAVDQGAGTYNMRGIAVDCIVNRDTLPDLRRHTRSIAAWLSKTGRLSFSDEPDKYYVGCVYDEMAFEQLMTHGAWTVVFRVQPMAYGAAVAASGEGSAIVTLPIDYQATAATPCRIIIRNTGTTDISAIEILQFIRTGGDF